MKRPDRAQHLVERDARESLRRTQLERVIEDIRQSATPDEIFDVIRLTLGTGDELPVDSVEENLLINDTNIRSDLSNAAFQRFFELPEETLSITGFEQFLVNLEAVLGSSVYMMESSTIIAENSDLIGRLYEKAQSDGLVTSEIRHFWATSVNPKFARLFTGLIPMLYMRTIDELLHRNEESE